jgi:hypothetical protein
MVNSISLFIKGIHALTFSTSSFASWKPKHEGSLQHPSPVERLCLFYQKAFLHFFKQSNRPPSLLFSFLCFGRLKRSDNNLMHSSATLIVSQRIEWHLP